MDTSLTGFYSDPATKAMREPAPKLTTDDQLQSARQQLTEAGKSKGMLKQAQAQESAEQAKILSEADVNTRKKFAESVENDPFKKAWEEKTKEASDTKFVPTQETAGDLGLLFTLTNILGFAIGGKSKGNAQAAMSAMNGMLEGHQKGRQDIYKQEKDKFDENFKTLDKTIQSLKTQYEDAMKTYANDREEGMAKARMAIAEHNARFIQDSLEKFGPAYAYDQIRDTVSMLEKAKAAEQKLQDAEERRRMEQLRLNQSAQQHQESMGLRREEMYQRERLSREKQGFGAGPSGLVAEYMGVNLPAKQAQPIIDSAAAIGEARQLQDIVKNNRGIVGREGQVRQFVDRYVKSAQTGEAPPSDQESGLDQDALLFAKRYASYLVNYERSLAPGARGFTVAFQNRFNNLMQQNQFNADGMIKLLDDQQREVATRATAVDKHVNRNNLTKLGDDVAGRSLSAGESAAPAPAAATAKAMPSGDKLKTYAAEHFNGDEAAARQYLQSQGYK